MISKSLKNSKDNPNDIIYTPKELAKNCINSFTLEKDDIVLDAFYGQGIFYNNYPSYVKKEFTEIEQPYNKDFFKYNNKVDWIITNPPFSKINDVLEHTINITNKGFGYILAAHNLTEKRVKYINDNGYGITGFAFYWVKDWFGFPCIFIKVEKNKPNNFLFDIKNYGYNDS
tara:strand:+ start:354 stop:869 length:516 start_codon:yes stop_codon:yes gene_type:complete